MLNPAPSTAGRAKGKNIIAIASGKGGVGKTWLAITLAHAMALKDRRVLLFDGDLGLANLDIQLGLMPTQDLGNVIAGRLTLNQAVLPFAAGGFDIIAGRSGAGSLANVPPSRLQMLSEDLTLLGQAYDRVILDLGAGVERTVRQLTANVGTVVVVATDEPTSLTDAYAFIKLTHMERPGLPICIVINAANSSKEGERTYNTLLKACEGFLKISPVLLGVVRRDEKVRECIKAQMPLLSLHPTTEAAIDVDIIARKLLK